MAKTTLWTNYGWSLTTVDSDMGISEELLELNTREGEFLRLAREELGRMMIEIMAASHNHFRDRQQE